MDVFTIRLYQEFNASVIVTAPSVPYEGKQAIERAEPGNALFAISL